MSQFAGVMRCASVTDNFVVISLLTAVRVQRGGGWLKGAGVTRCHIMKKG
jgi:hypothetical protein